MIFVRAAAVAVALPVVASVMGCHDVSRFSSSGDHYEGSIVGGDFVRAGWAPATRLCLVLDASHLEDTPGSLTSSDGRFASTRLRPIPQIWHDSLSTLSFGEGRVQNLVYVASPRVDADTGGEALVVVSLMQSGDVEVRIFRGAPVSEVDAGGAGGNLFGVFSLTRSQAGGASCSF